MKKSTVDCMPWGKHKGTPLTEVPLNYLTWVMNSMAFPPECVSDELYRRLTANQPKSRRSGNKATDRKRREPTAVVRIHARQASVSATN